MFQVILNT